MSEEDDSTTTVGTAENAETKLSEDELRAWKADFKNSTALTQAIVRQIKEKNKNIKDHPQLKFSSTLAIFGMAKDDMEKFQSLYGTHYQSCDHYERAMKKEKKAKPVKELLAEMDKKISLGNTLPRGWKWVLQLWIGEKWWDWLYVSKSTLRGAGLGLFTARDFPVGSVIGYYVGPVAYQGEEPGGERPRTAELLKVGVVPTPYSITLRDKNGYWRVISPEPVRAGMPEPLFFGLHYMNNACETYTKQSTSSLERAAKLQNCELVEDGSVQTIKKLIKGRELFAPYKKSQARERKGVECGAKDSDSIEEKSTDSEDRKPAAVEIGNSRQMCKRDDGSIETSKRRRRGMEPVAPYKKRATREIGNGKSGAKEDESDESDDSTAQTSKRRRNGKEPVAPYKKRGPKKIGNGKSGAKKVESEQVDDSTASEDKKCEAVESVADDDKVKNKNIETDKKVIKGNKPVAWVKKIAARKNAFDKSGAKEVDNDEEEGTGRKSEAAEVGDDHGKVKKAGKGEDGNQIANSLVAYPTVAFDCEVASKRSMPAEGKKDQ
jgi:hypothetical protein